MNKITKVFTKGATLAIPHSQLFGNDGQPYSLSSKSVQFRMVKQEDGSIKVNDATAAATNPPGTDGRVQYQWQPQDVDTAGKFWFWWIVLYAGKKNFFPAADNEGAHLGEIIIEDTV